MRNFFFLFLLFSSFRLSAQDLRVMSFNIRYDNPGDTGNLWEARREKVAGLIRFHQASVIGMQEALHSQVRDLEKALPEYSWIGLGRDDGKTRGEYCPVFFDKSRLKLIQSGHFWLSERPQTPGSISWGAACTRMVSYACFQDRQTGFVFWIFNTHFDHVSAEARINSARLLSDSVRAIAGEQPVLITGDFNATLESPAGKELLNQFVHPAALASRPVYGPDFSYKAFDRPGKAGNVIDHIFLYQTTKLSVIRYGILSDNWNGKYPSDHLPVLTEIRYDVK